MFSESLGSHMDIFAPAVTTTIDDFKVEEFTSTEPGILPGFQGRNKGISSAIGVDGSESEVVGEDYDVVQHDLLVCQPCDEDVEVVAQGKTNSRTKERERETRMEYIYDNGEEDYDEDDESWHGDSNEDKNVEVVAEGKTNSRSKKRKSRGITIKYYDDDGDNNDENDGSWNGDSNGATWHLCKDCDYKSKQN